MFDPILTFALPERRAHQPFKIQGAVTPTVFAIAQHDPKHGCHTFQLTLSEQRKFGEQIAKAAHRPLCNLHLIDVTLPDEVTSALEENARLTALADQLAKEKDSLEALLAASKEETRVLTERVAELRGKKVPAKYHKPSKPLEQFTFKQAYAYARHIELPSFSVIARSGHKEPLIAAIKAHENASNHPGGTSNQAPPESVPAAA